MSTVALKQRRSAPAPREKPEAGTRPSSEPRQPSAGVPSYLAPVQLACSTCGAGESPRRDEELPALQRDALGLGATGADGEGGGAAQRVAGAGVAQAGSPLPHAGRIQALFGRHDISGVRAQVGGPAARASRQLGARAYTLGGHIGFKTEPDLRLAAHEAAHVVQQQRGVWLKGGVGQAGDAYERQADAVAERVAANRSAEDLLDRDPQTGDAAPCACGGTCARCTGEASGGLQMDLEVNARREFEPVSGDADAAEGGAGARASVPRGEAGAGDAVEADAGESDEAEAEAGGDAEAGTTGGGGGGGAVGATGPADADGAPPSSTAAATPLGPDAAAPDGSTPAGAEGGVAAEPAAEASATPQCYRGRREEPAEPPDPMPPNPPAPEVERRTNEGEDEELPEADNCAEATGAGTELTSPPSGAGDGGMVSTGMDSAAAPAGGGGVRRASGSGAGGSGGGEAAAMPPVSPLEGAIASGEVERDAAVGSYASARTALGTASAGTAALRAGVGFVAHGGEDAAAVARRRDASARADRFFGGAADRLDAAIGLAAGPVPDQIGLAAEAGKAQIAAALESEKNSISGRIAQARVQARRDASIARGAVRSQTAAYTGEVNSQAAAAIASLQAAHAVATGAVTGLETSTLEQINQTYATGRTDLEGVGIVLGAECVARGTEFATTYRGFSTCTENGMFDGDLSERRSEAQAQAAEEVSRGYHDRFVSGARQRARETTRDGRRANRCAVIAAATQCRAGLDNTLQGLVQAIEQSRDAALAQAAGTQDRLLESIQSGLAATLRQLDQQEQRQRQAANDSAYLQQLLQEQMAHASAAAIQQAVARAVEMAQAGLAEVHAQFNASAAPDPAALDGALQQVEGRVGSALDGLMGHVHGGALGTEQRLASAAGQGVAALAEVTRGNDEEALGIEGGFTASMSAIAGRDIFAAQRRSFSEQMAQSTEAGTAALEQVVDGMQDNCDDTLALAEQTLTQAHTDLDANLRQQRRGLDRDMTRQADEAASHERPAWKTVLAIVLFVVVILIVVAVIVASGGAALAPLGALITALGPILTGAIVGAITSGLLYMATSLWRNDEITWGGLGMAVLLGAATGALGGGIGAWAGSAVGAALSTASRVAQVAGQLAAALGVGAGLDVVTQFVMGGLSFDRFSSTQLGITVVVTLLTFGLGAAAARPRAPPTTTAPPPASEPTIGFGRTPAPRAPGTPEPRIGFGRNPVGRPPGAGPATEPTIGFGRTPAPRASGTPPTPEPRIGFGRNPVGRPPGAGPATEPTIGFGRTPAPRAPGTPPTPEPRIGFGRNPVGRPPGAGPVEEPTIGFGRTPRARPAVPAEPAATAPPETVVSGGPRPRVRGGPGAVVDGDAPRAMARPDEPPLLNPPEPPGSAPRETARPRTGTVEELPPPARAATPTEEAPPRAVPPAEEPAAPARPAAAEEPPAPQPWEMGSRPRRYAEYVRGLARTRPGETPMTPEQWWRDIGYRRYLAGLARRGNGERPLSRDEWWEQFGRRPPRNPAGGPGDPEHQAVVADLRARAETAYPPPRYRVMSNQRVPTPSGYRKPDVAVIDTHTGRVVRVYEAARFNAAGGFEQAYEAPKILDYEALGIPYEFHPVGPNRPPGGILTSRPPTP
jgi:hypothetical protein